MIELIYGFSELDAPIDGRTWREHLADYLLANGVIVPPCKVGDKIYTIYPYGSDIFEHTVHAISANANEQATDIRLCAYDESKDNARYSSAWIGRNVFLSRKDAEKAINEREYTK